MSIALDVQPIEAKETERLVARFMLPDLTEHSCRVTNLTTTGAVFLTDVTPHIGVTVVAYIGELGRIEAVSGVATEGGFHIEFSLTGPRLERLQQRITAMLEAGLGATVTPRRFTRIEPSEKLSHITLPDGRVYRCEVLDISVGSAAIKTDVIPGLGTFLMLGRMKGRVVRYLDQGVAIEFVKYLEPSQLHNVGVELHT